MSQNNINTIIESVKTMTAIELSELVKAIEEEFGVSASASMVVAGGAAVADEDGGAAQAEKTEFKVILKTVGGGTLPVIKALRAAVPGLGLKEAKDMAVDGSVVKESASKEEAEAIKKVLVEAGATVDVV